MIVNYYANGVLTGFLVNFSLVGPCLHAASCFIRLKSGITGSTPTEFLCKWNETFVRYVIGFPFMSINPWYLEKSKKKLSVKLVVLTKVEAAFSYCATKTVYMHLFGEFTERFISNKSKKSPKFSPSFWDSCKPNNVLQNESELDRLCHKIKG